MFLHYKRIINHITEKNIAGFLLNDMLPLVTNRKPDANQVPNV